jgi:hypothetical protein
VQSRSYSGVHVWVRLLACVYIGRLDYRMWNLGFGTSTLKKQSSGTNATFVRTSVPLAMSIACSGSAGRLFPMDESRADDFFSQVDK